MPKKAGRDPRLARAGVVAFNTPRRTPDHATKSHIVVAKVGSQVRTIRFGQQGVRTNQTVGQRRAFESRHRSNIARGPLSAAYWSAKVKWDPKKTRSPSHKWKTGTVTKKQAGAAVKKNPALWERSKARAKAAMGGKHSARAMQLAVKYYKAAGGAYIGEKSPGNRLAAWTKQDWGDTGTQGSRYLPKRARDSLTAAEKKATNAKKRADTRAGRQFSAQPKAIAQKTSKYRSGAS